MKIKHNKERKKKGKPKLNTLIILEICMLMAHVMLHQDEQRTKIHGTIL